MVLSGQATLIEVPASPGVALVPQLVQVEDAYAVRGVRSKHVNRASKPASIEVAAGPGALSLVSTASTAAAFDFLRGKSEHTNIRVPVIMDPPQVYKGLVTLLLEVCIGKSYPGFCTEFQDAGPGFSTTLGTYRFHLVAGWLRLQRYVQ